MRNIHSQVGGEQDCETPPPPPRYAIECPAKPAKENETAQNVFRSKEYADVGPEVAYAVRPGHWGEMMRARARTRTLSSSDCSRGKGCGPGRIRMRIQEQVVS
jgi:hypothetical protein